MAIESNFDRLAFLNVEEFAVQVILHPNSTPQTINAIWDNGHFEIANGVSVISTTQPSLMVRSMDVANAEQGDEVSVDGTIYEIADIQPDGTGMSMLMVHKA